MCTGRHVGFGKGLGGQWGGTAGFCPLGNKSIWLSNAQCAFHCVWGIIQVDFKAADLNQWLPFSEILSPSFLDASPCVNNLSCVSCARLQALPCWKAAQDEPGLYHRWCKTHLFVLWQHKVNTGWTAVYPFTQRSYHLAQNMDHWLSEQMFKEVCVFDKIITDIFRSLYLTTLFSHLFASAWSHSWNNERTFPVIDI